MNHREVARDIFRELIEIDTTDAFGSVTLAAESMAVRLRAAGFPAEDVRVAGPHPKKHNLVARLRGNGRAAPILLLAHIDVVGVEREFWNVDPFAFLEQDGHYYGRGTTDDKAMAAIWIATLLRLRDAEPALDRDVIVALTADEEGGSHNGVRWLLREHPGLVRAEFGLNEGGYGRIREGRRIANQIQASEKTPVILDVVASGSAGHSSLPAGDTSITRLARAVGRISSSLFPLELSDVTRQFFARMSEIESGTIADDMRSAASDLSALERLAAVPYFEGLLRTTCTVTRLHAGEADNVISQAAHAVIDCRMLPGTSVADVERILHAAIDDDHVTITPRFRLDPAPASSLRYDLLEAVERFTGELWPGVPVVPVMSIGATDSAHFRRAGIPMFGVSGLFLDINDTRAHGHDERVLVESFHDSQEFLYRLVRSLAGS